MGTLIGAFIVWVALVKTPALSSSEERGSYSLGRQIGQNLRNQNFSIHAQAFSLGVDDVYSDNQSRLSNKDAQEALAILQQNAAAQSKAATKNTFKSDDNSTVELEKDPSTIQTAQGNLVKIEAAGRGPQPQTNSVVVFHLEIINVDNQVLYSSETNNRPIEEAFGNLPTGLSEAISLLKPNGRALLLADSKTLQNGRLPVDIPVDQQLKCRVKLLEIR